MGGESQSTLESTIVKPSDRELVITRVFDAARVEVLEAAPNK